MIGKVFERLTVLATAGQGRWLCRCSCGVEKIVRGQYLSNGMTRSCGCLRQDRMRTLRRTHGESQRKNWSREYHAWRAMKIRCQDPERRWHHGRGITVCRRWRDNFGAFIADMGRCPTGCSLDRIRGDRNYTPSNCRWATKHEQANNRSNNKWVTHEGRRQTVAQWMREFGLSRWLTERRLAR